MFSFFGKTVENLQPPEILHREATKRGDRYEKGVCEKDDERYEEEARIVAGVKPGEEVLQGEYLTREQRSNP